MIYLWRIFLILSCFFSIKPGFASPLQTSTEEIMVAGVKAIHKHNILICDLRQPGLFSIVADTSKCATPEFSQFDFWIGDWALSWNDTLHGINKITKTLDGCVIHENFSDPNSKFFGQSFSVYDPLKNQWQQTWVDNHGYYMTFTGGMINQEMILSRSILTKDGKELHQRMVFYNISKDALDWSWQSSTDGGQNWKQNWLIHYQRK